jgi:hypothetical protein
MALMALQRLSTEHGARELLQRLVDAGRCTIEQLDTPPPGHLNPTAYRNLLRDGDSVQPAQTPPPDFDRTAEFPF